MDSEIKDMLIKLLEGQSRLESKLTRLETESKKYITKFETIEQNIKIIEELQSGHNNQNELSLRDNVSLIKEKADVLSSYQYLKGYIKNK